MNKFIFANISMSSLQVMHSAKNVMQGRINVLRMESKQDGGNEKKDALADELEKKSNALNGDLMEHIEDVNNSLKPEDASKEKELSSKDKENIDKLELSGAVKTNGLIEKEPVVAEPVLYASDGTIAKASINGKHTFNGVA